MIWLFGILSFILFVLLCASVFYLLRFARIILVIEDDFSDAVEVFSNTEELLVKILEMKLFFDSKDVQITVHQVMNEVRANKAVVNRMALRFVERSKQKYVSYTEEEPSMQEMQERILREQLRARADSASEEKW
jgi:hypothetical protein